MQWFDRRSLLPLVLACLAAAAGLAADDPPAEPAADPGISVIRDEHLRQRLTAALERMDSEKRTRKVPDLLREHPKGPVELSLPDPYDKDLSGPDLYRRLAAGTLIVGSRYRCKKCSQWHLGEASGFLISADGALVTNHHVLTAEDREAILAMDARGTAYPVVGLLAEDPVHDVAILRIEGRGFSPLPLAPSDPLPGTEVAVLSHPDNRYYMYTTGVVSRWARPTEAKGRGGSAEDGDTMCITAPFAPGSSGAAVADRRGNVLGIAQRISPILRPKEEHQPEYAAMVVQMAVPVRWVRALVKQVPAK
ncbi:MAG: trypsin-like peptidase domain-containing protein [Planctomycetes bacterium]|nr:trypsin-like peptidase domain-containing protein [Planctomycetota bacterium]